MTGCTYRSPSWRICSSSSSLSEEYRSAMYSIVSSNHSFWCSSFAPTTSHRRMWLYSSSRALSNAVGNVTLPGQAGFLRDELYMGPGIDANAPDGRTGVDCVK